MLLNNAFSNTVKGKIISLQLSNLNKGSYTIKLYNSIGQELLAQTLQHNGGSASQTIFTKTVLAKGVYEIVIANGTNQITKTVIID